YSLISSSSLSGDRLSPFDSERILSQIPVFRARFSSYSFVASLLACLRLSKKVSQAVLKRLYSSLRCFSGVGPSCFHSSCNLIRILEALCQSVLFICASASAIKASAFSLLAARSSSSSLKKTFLLWKNFLKCPQKARLTSFPFSLGTGPTASHSFCISRTSLVLLFQSLIRSALKS